MNWQSEKKQNEMIKKAQKHFCPVCGGRGYDVLYKIINKNESGGIVGWPEFSYVYDDCIICDEGYFEMYFREKRGCG